MGVPRRIWLIVAAIMGVGLGLLAFAAIMRPAPPPSSISADVLRDRATAVARDAQATVAAIQAAQPRRGTAGTTPTTDVFTPRQVASPTAAVASPTAAVALPLAPGRVGLQTRTPPDGARVPASLVVAGIQEQPTPAGVHVWAFVRADVPGAGWYPWHRGEIVAGPDTTWSIDLYLGGPPGTRHELQVGIVDDAGHADLTTFLRDNPDQPLPNLPDGFTQEAQITVTLE